MKTNIKSSLLNLFRILLLITGCLAIAFLIVWPLWKFSTTLSSVYTVIVLTVITFFILFLLFSKLKKTKPIKIAHFFTNLVLIFAGISMAIYFILSLHRILALAVILILIILEIFINNVFIKKEHV